MDIRIKTFQQLSTQELYAMLQLRMEVFILEQECRYMDCDDRDQASQHVMIFDNNVLVGYCRVIPTGIAYQQYCCIGRVVTKASHRRLNIGRKIMEEAIALCKKLYIDAIKISAQTYLIPFYEGYGFKVVSELYLEDNLPHKAMLKEME